MLNCHFSGSLAPSNSKGTVYGPRNLGGSVLLSAYNKSLVLYAIRIFS